MAHNDDAWYPHPDLMRPRRRIKAYADAARDDPVRNEFFVPQLWTWHGTMTACCAAGNGYVSGGRYRGLAHHADVVLIKASIDGGRIQGKNVAHAIRFPLRYPHLGIKILNVSLGVFPSDPDKADVEAAVREVVEKGIAVFCAVGNEAGAVPRRVFDDLEEGAGELYVLAERGTSRAALARMSKVVIVST